MKNTYIKQTGLEQYFSDLHFDEETHSYTLNGKDAKLTSVTKFVSTFKQPFETYQVSSFVAKAAAKKGKPSDPAYYRKIWKARGRVAAEIGTAFHLFIEQMPTLDEPSNNYERAGVKWFEDCIKDKEEIVAQELRMYHGSLAGTLDLLTKNDKDEYTLHDFKTNASLTKSYSKMLSHFADFDDNALNMYSIQLSLYAYMLKERCNIDVKNLLIVHIKEDGTYDVVPINDSIRQIVVDLLNKSKDAE